VVPPGTLPGATSPGAALSGAPRAGLGRGRLYPGSWSQWSNDPARPVATTDPTDRDVSSSPHSGPDTDFTRVGEIFEPSVNGERKKPFDIRSLMRAVADADHPTLERWADMHAAESVVVLDARAFGGQAGASARIENYLGFPAGISGQALTGLAYVQAQKFGARMLIPTEVVSLDLTGTPIALRLAGGGCVKASTVVVATGARYRRPDVPNLGDFEGRGVWYWASPIEARLCRNEEIVVVGGGNSAGQAVVFLRSFAAKIWMLIRGPSLAESMSRYLIDRVQRIANVDIMLGTEIGELLGDRALEAVTVEDRQSGAQRTLKARALFVFIGVSPCTGWLGDLVDLDGHGFVRTGHDAPSAAGTGWQRSALETSQPGMFAVGDVRSGSAKRVAAAVGEGAMVIRLALERARQP